MQVFCGTPRTLGLALIVFVFHLLIEFIHCPCFKAAKVVSNFNPPFLIQSTLEQKSTLWPSDTLCPELPHFSLFLGYMFVRNVVGQEEPTQPSQFEG